MQISHSASSLSVTIVVLSSACSWQRLPRHTESGWEGGYLCHLPAVGTDALRLHPFSITGRWFAAYTLSYDEVRSAILSSGLWWWKDAGLRHIPPASVGTQTRVIPAQSLPMNLSTGLSWTILYIPRMKLSGSWQMLSLFLTWSWFQLQVLLVRISGSMSSREMVL